MSYLRIRAQKWDKNRWCRWFGHIATGCYDEPYGQLRGGPVDGLNVEHISVMVRCDRCGEQVSAVKFHKKVGQ